MRVNYAGEVAAQGLYLGADLFEKDVALSQFYKHSMQDEFVHLDWCGSRLKSMGGRRSVFNPLWFFGSFSIGMCTQAFGSQYALGFVEETEKQVLMHLEGHLTMLPGEDIASRKVLENMIEDEKSHGNEAHSLGAKSLPKPICDLMHTFGKVLTTLSAWG